MTTSPFLLASDHAGIDLKTELVKALEERSLEPIDLGTHDHQSVDYPDYADKLARELIAGRAPRGLLVCGTGIGIGIAANRHPGVRAAICHDVTTTRLARAHNDANVLCLGARVTGLQVALDCLDAFLETGFEGGRHQRRVDKLDAVCL
jgi:ribose 5-phosphate isomerase B